MCKHCKRENLLYPYFNIHLLTRIMFVLVQFEEDNIYKICKWSSVKIKDEKFFATYGFQKYECKIIAKNSDQLMLQDIVRKMVQGVPYVLLKDFNINSNNESKMLSLSWNNVRHDHSYVKDDKESSNAGESEDLLDPTITHNVLMEESKQDLIDPNSFKSKNLRDSDVGLPMDLSGLQMTAYEDVTESLKVVKIKSIEILEDAKKIGLQRESEDLLNPAITHNVLMEESKQDLFDPNSFKSEKLRDSDVGIPVDLSYLQMTAYEDVNESLKEQPIDDSIHFVPQSVVKIKSIEILDDANKIDLQHYQQIKNGSSDNIDFNYLKVFGESGPLLDDVELEVDLQCFSKNVEEYYANDAMNIEDSFNVMQSKSNQVEEQKFLENENLSISNFDDIDNSNNDPDYVPEERVDTDKNQIKLDSDNQIAGLKKKKSIKNLKITTKLVNKDAPLLELDLEANKDKVLGEALSKPSECMVESTANGSKIYNCPFCPKQLKGKLSDHLKNVHKSHPEVIALQSLPKIKRLKGQPLSPKEQEKNQLYANLRKKGAFKYNYTANKTDKIQTVRRTQKNVLPKMLNEYRICPFCYGTYGKESIRKHLNKCGGISSSAGKCVKPYHNLVIGDVHPEANIFLRVVIARLNDDEEANVAKHDLLIVTYANYQAIKFKTSSHHNKQIRAEMRLLARILLTMRSKNSNITDLVSMLESEYSKIYFETANELGKFNPSRGIFEAPATARDVGRLIKNVCELWITECIERKLPAENRKNVEDFLLVHNKKFPPLVSRTVAESQTKLDIEKGIQHLPATSDIKKLKLYVTNIREEAFKKLTKDYDYPTWLALLKSTLITILILNRRRPGELSRLHLTYYNNFSETISDSINPEFYKKMSKTSKAIASNYVRILCRGKQNFKVVPILLNKHMKESIDLILQFRNEAKIPKDNPYIFGLPFTSVNSTEFRFAEACPILADYSKKCGANIPHLLRTVKLRKHIATASVALDLTEMQVENLSKFLGHEKDIHLKVYRQRAAAKDILEVSQWLEYAQGEYAETPDGNMIRIEEESLSDMEEDGEDDKENMTNDDEQPQNKNKQMISFQDKMPMSEQSSNIPETTNFTPGSKRKWDSASSNIIANQFLSRYINNEKIPGSELSEFIDKHKILTGRKVDQIRSHLQHLKKQKFIPSMTKSTDEKLSRPLKNQTSNELSKPQIKRKRSSSPASTVTCRNRIPSSIYKHFKEFIKKKELPTITDVSKVYDISPTFVRYNPLDIQNLVKKAIDFENDEDGH